jgi:hypothetical protein
MSNTAARYTRTHAHIVHTNNYATEPLFDAAELHLQALLDGRAQFEMLTEFNTPAVMPRRYSDDVIAVNAFGHVARKPRIMRINFTIRHGVACRVYTVAPFASALQAMADMAAPFASLNAN